MSDPDATPTESPPGRLKAAWSVLRGESIVPAQIRAEWAEYQIIFQDLLTRQSALLARQAKMEKRRLERLTVPPDPEAIQPPARTGKADLRRRAALAKGLGGQISLLKDRANVETA